MTQERAGNEHRPTLHASRPRPPFRQNNRPAAKPKGHDAALKGFQDAGTIIEIITISDGQALKGKIVDRDKFTITIESTINSRRTILYKHGIESITVAI